MTILQQIYNESFDINKLTNNQLANLLAQLKIKTTNERLNELKNEYEIKKKKYNEMLEEKNNILKTETINKLKATMKVKLQEVPMAEYCWKGVKNAFPFGLPFKDVGEMDVIKIDEETGNIIIRRNSTIEYLKSYDESLYYRNGMWISGDRIRANLIC